MSFFCDARIWFIIYLFHILGVDCSESPVLEVNFDPAVIHFIPQTKFGATFLDKQKWLEMEGFDGLGGYEAASTTTTSLDNLASQYETTYEKLERRGFRPYNLYASRIKSERIEKKNVVCQEMDEIFGCSSSEKEEEAPKQCCGCFQYSDWVKTYAWCKMCAQITGTEEPCFLCMNCMRTMGKPGYFIMVQCGQCAV